ncbi:hypothetical protein [Nocardia brevicatena]|uniref:hypothetical protein n=1 Tax=Nocardia brevicatena TaxID=37327 RepID=UPI0012FCAACE|nr:hypothetical protein [Nocardia brevicatena]
MGDKRDSRGPGRAAPGAMRFGALLAEGLLRRELLIGAVLLSSFTIVIGLTATGVGWKTGYCVAGGLGIAGAFVMMRGTWTLQWWGSLGICVLNIILLIVYGRLTGDV